MTRFSRESCFSFSLGGILRRSARRPFFRRGAASMGIALLSLWGSIAPAGWEPLGPSGGSLIGVVTNPADASQVTVISDSLSTVYRSMDGCNSWSEIGQIGSSYYLLDTSAYDFSRMFALTYFGCLRTTDGGVSWNYSAFPSASGPASRVCAHPTDANTVFAAGFKSNPLLQTQNLAFYKSVDGGQTWGASSALSFEYLGVRDMAVSKSNPSIIYVAGYKMIGGIFYGALLRSVNGGASWSDISGLVDTSSSSLFESVAIDPLNADRVYVGGRYVYRTANGGATWSKSSFMAVYALGIDGGNPAKVYAAGYGIVYASANYGQTWNVASGATDGYPCQVAVAPAAPSNVYVSTDTGLYRSGDSGLSWAEAHEGIYGAIVPALAVAPSSPSTVFIESFGQNVLVSYDSGDAWQDLEYFYGCGNSCAVLVHYQNPDIILSLEGEG